MEEPTSQLASEMADDEIDLKQLLLTLWHQRGLIIAIALMTLLGVMIYHLARMTFDSPDSVSYPISLTFLDGKSDTYPNGAVFSRQDIIASRVVEDAITKTGLKLDVNNLLINLSAEHSNEFLQQSQRRLAEILTDKKSPKELVDAAMDAQEELRSKAGGFVLLKLDYIKLGLTADQAEKLIRQIPASWADNAIRAGLLDADIERPNRAFSIDVHLNLIDAFDSANDYLRSLSKAIDSLAELSGTASLVVNGLSLDDIRRRIMILNTTDIGPLREFAYSNSKVLAESNPAIEVRLFARQRLFKLEKERLEKLITSYEESLAQIDASQRTEVRGTIPQGSHSQQVSPQLDKTFLESLLQMGVQLGNVESRKEIYQKRTKAVEELLSLEKELAILTGFDKQFASKLDPQKILQEALTEIEAKINGVQVDLLAFIDAYRENSLSKGARLYVATSGAIFQGGTSIVVRQIGMHLVLAGFLGLMIGIFVALARGVFAHTSASSAE